MIWNLCMHQAKDILTSEALSLAGKNLFSANNGLFKFLQNSFLRSCPSVCASSVYWMVMIFVLLSRLLNIFCSLCFFTEFMHKKMATFITNIYFLAVILIKYFFIPTDARLRNGTDAAWNLTTEQADAPVWTEPAPPVRGLVRDLSGKRRKQSGISLKEIRHRTDLQLYIKLWCAFHQSVQSWVVKFTNFIKFCQICFSKYCVTVFFIELLLGFKEINKLWTQILLIWHFDNFMGAFTENFSHRNMFNLFQVIAVQNAAAMWWLDEFYLE